MKKNNKKGFTLAELLIVVAIIAVLVAISIPIFSSQLTKARQATNEANARAAKAATVVWYLDQDTTPADGTVRVYDNAKGSLSDGTALTSFTVSAADSNDQTKYPGDKVYGKVSVTINASGEVTVYGFGD